MATRNSPARRIPGSPLTGVLRATARATRSTSRSSVAARGPEGPQGVASPPGPVAPGVAAHATGWTETDGAGIATLQFPATDGLPHVVAVAEHEGPVVVTVGTVAESYVYLRAWLLDGSPAQHVALHVAVYGRPVGPEPVEPTPVD